MNTLTRYIGREVLAAILLIFAALVMLFAFFDLIHELGDVGKGGYTVTSAFLFVVLQMPSRMYELFPVAALIGTLFALSQLVASSEYTVMRASGASLLQVTWALVRVGVPIAVVTFLAGEFVAPPAERLAQGVRGAAMGDSRRIVAQQFQSGFWFKQDQTFVNIRSVLADMTIVGVRIYEFDANLALKQVRVAESGSFTGNGHWQLTNVATTDITPAGTRVSKLPTLAWETVLRPSLLSVYQVAPERLELNTLYDNIRVLGGQKTSRFEIAFWNKVFYPAGRGRDDDPGAAVLVFPAPRRRRGLPHLPGHDARALVLPGRAAVLQPRGAQRLAAAVFRGVPAGGVPRRHRRAAVVAGAAVVLGAAGRFRRSGPEPR